MRKRRHLALAATAIALALSVTPASAIYDSPTDQAPSALRDAVSAAEASNWVDARRILERHLNAHPSDADAWSLLGRVLRRSGDTRAAMVAYQRALAANPTHTAAMAYLGMAHVLRGERDQAVRLLAQIVSLCGEDCAATRALESVLGDPARADSVKLWR